MGKRRTLENLMLVPCVGAELVRVRVSVKSVGDVQVSVRSVGDVQVSVRGPVIRAPGDGRTDWFTGGAETRRPGAGPLAAAGGGKEYGPAEGRLLVAAGRNRSKRSPAFGRRLVFPGLRPKRARRPAHRHGRSQPSRQ